MKNFGSALNFRFSLVFLLMAGVSICSAEDIEIDMGGNQPAKAAVKPSGSQGETSNSEKTPEPTKSISSNNENSSIQKIKISEDGDGSIVQIIGRALATPILDKVTATKLLLKFDNTVLKVPGRIKGAKGYVKEVRTSPHGKTAWVVVEGSGVNNLSLEKREDGFALVGNSAAQVPAPVAPVEKKSVGSEKSLFLRLVDSSIRPQTNGLKLVLTSDGPSKYSVRKLTQPDKLVIHLLDTRLELQEKNKTYKNGDPEVVKGGLLSMEYRQLGQSYSPISEVLLTMLPGTTYQIDRDLNQIIISLAALPIVQKNEEAKGNMVKLISLDVESADLNAVVKTLVAEAGFEINFVAGPLNGTVTQKLKNVPFKSAMADLLAPGGYGYDLQGNTLRIGPQANLVNTKRAMPHLTEILTPSGGLGPAAFDTLVRTILPQSNAVLAVPDTNRNVLILSGTSSDIEEYKRTIKDLKMDSEANGERITRVIKLNYADAAALAPIISQYKTPVGQIQINGQRLIIWETAANMGVLLELIKELDTKPAQVLIESSIVEVDDETDLGIGVSWSANRNIGSPTISSSVNETPTGGSAGILSFGTVNSGLNINATIEAIVTKKKGKVVSRPRVATQSGVAAEIQETENVIISTITQNNIPNVGIQTITTFQQLGLPIDLKVTPRITDDGRITTDINASITSQSGPGPANGPPPTNVQVATTKLTTKNGETIVIGGLVREVATDQVTGVPLLSSLPILGALFQDHEKVNRKEELIIFITPTLLED